MSGSKFVHTFWLNKIELKCVAKSKVVLLDPIGATHGFFK